MSTPSFSSLRKGDFGKSIPARKSQNQQNSDGINEVKSEQKVQIPPIIRSGLMDGKITIFKVKF